MLTIADAQAMLKRHGFEPFDPEPYQRQLQKTADDFGIRIHPAPMWRAIADSHTKEIHTPWPPRTEAEVACAAHELGHCIQPRCSNKRPLHYQDYAGTRYKGCVGCETSAWALAIVILRPLTWTRPMHDHLSRCLATYRSLTRAWPGATAELDRVSSNLTYCRLKQAEVKATLPKERLR